MRKGSRRPDAATTSASPLVMASRNAPGLSAQDEQALFASYRANGNPHAKHKIAITHFRVVAGEAAKLRGYNIDQVDLISEGNLGLVNAIESFDPGQGVRFSAYARPIIRFHMLALITKYTSIISVPDSSAIRSIFFKLNRKTDALRAANGGILPPDADQQLAQSFSVSVNTLRALQARMRGQSSLDAPISTQDYEGNDVPLIELTPDPDGTDPETALIEAEEQREEMKKFQNALSSLDSRERAILLARNAADKDQILDLKHIAQEYGITPQRVHQIEKRARAKLMKACNPS